MSFFERWRSLSRYKSKQALDAHNEKLDLEKGDMLAMVLAGFLVFLPILLVIALILVLLLLFFRAI